MRKVIFKRIVSLALATAMAASVCSTALADDAVTEQDAAPTVSESVQAEPELAAVSEAADSQAESEPEQAEIQPESQAQTAESAPEQQEEPAESEIAASEPAAEPVQSEASEQIAVFAQEEETAQPAAAVNGQEYDSLQAAFDAVSEGTVVLQQDVHLEKPVTIAEGKNLTLDLNGHKVTAASSASVFDNRYEAFKVYGTLTLEDSVGTGMIEVGGIQQYNAGFYVFESGKLTIESGTVKVNTSNDAVYVKGGTLIVNGGYLYGGSYGINDYGNANIEIHGGTIATMSSSKGDYPVMMSNGTLSITGGTFEDPCYGENETDIANLEGAKISISGGSFGKEPLPEQIAVGYEAVEKDGLWVVQKLEPAATVNGQEYDSLQAAFDAVSEGTVVLQQDIALQETATVAEGKKITLDLNGHKVHGGSYHNENGYHSSAIAVKGSLTIQDNSTAGEIYNESLNMPTHGVCLESAHAELIVESGKILSSAYAVYAPVGTVTVNGGTVESTAMSALAAGGNANIIIYNGEIKSDKAYSYDAPIRLNNAAQLTIYGGKISANSYADDYRDIYIVEESNAKVSISGGSFGKEPLPEQIAAGYEAVEKDGAWIVQKFEPIATVNGTGYKTLQAAFAAAKNNEVITLAKDTAENIAVPAGVDYILNLNTHTLTGTITIPEKGVLAVKGGSMAAASEEAVLFDNSGLLHIVDGNYSSKNLFKASENAKIEVEHGYFGAKVDARYLVEGTICKQIGNADQRYPFVVTPCAPSDVTTETEKPTSKVEENKDLGENADAAAKAAESIKVVESSESAVKAAAEAKAKVNENTLQQAIKALGEKNPDVIASDVRIVTKPELTVKPTAMEKGKSITFEISLSYTLEATDGTNAIELETQPITDLDQEIEISLGDVSAAGIAASENDTVYIKHIHNGEVSFYTTESTIANGTLETVSFKTKGFSPFTLLVSPSVSVDMNGTSVSLDPDKIGQNLADLLPYAARDGYYVTGWTFTAGSQTLTTQKMQLTAALFSDLLDLAAGGTVSMTPEYTKNSSGSSSSSSSGSSYIAPDDSVYYTCVKCGYHDWTATANGYQCDHCGYLEVVKQIAGYERVKGVCEPAAVAQSKAAPAAVTTATSPKTGDASNLALAVAALAASLLGVGALLVLRKKNR